MYHVASYFSLRTGAEASGNPQSCSNCEKITHGNKTWLSTNIKHFGVCDAGRYLPNDWSNNLLSQAQVQGTRTCDVCTHRCIIYGVPFTHAHQVLCQGRKGPIVEAAGRAEVTFVLHQRRQSHSQNSHLLPVEGNYNDRMNRHKLYSGMMYRALIKPSSMLLT